MLGACPNHGVFHDDYVAPDPDGATGLTDEARAVQDAHARSNRDVAAQRRIGCHPGRRVDRWTLSRMIDQHRLAILSSRRIVARSPFKPRPRWSVSRAVVYGRYLHNSVLQLAARFPGTGQIYQGSSRIFV
jgi:hypothetical protein